MVPPPVALSFRDPAVNSKTMGGDESQDARKGLCDAWLGCVLDGQDPPYKLALLGIIPVSCRLAIIATIRVHREDSGQWQHVGVIPSAHHAAGCFNSI